MEFSIGYLFYAVIGVAVLAAIIVGVLFWRIRRVDPRQPIFVLTNASISKRYFDRDLMTARMDEKQESYTLDGDAFRRRATGKHEMAQFCFQWSATPAFPCQAESYRTQKIEEAKNLLTDTAVRFAHREREHTSRMAAKVRASITYRYIIVGTVIAVIVIAIVALIVTKVV